MQGRTTKEPPREVLDAFANSGDRIRALFRADEGFRELCID